MHRGGTLEAYWTHTHTASMWEILGICVVFCFTVENRSTGLDDNVVVLLGALLSPEPVVHPILISLRSMCSVAIASTVKC